MCCALTSFYFLDFFVVFKKKQREKKRMAESDAKSPFLTMKLANDGLFEKGMMRVEIVFLRDPQRDDDVDVYANAMDSVYGKDKEFTILFDASLLNNVPMKYLRALKKRIDETADKQDRLMTASAALLPKGIAMKIIQTLFMKKTTESRKICTTVAEAQTFLDTFAAASATTGS